MKCKLKLINDNWYAENLGESGYLDPYNFLSTGNLYRVHHSSPRLLKEGSEVECEYITEFTHPELYKDVPWGEGETYVKVLSLARQILKETPPEIKERVRSRVNLDEAVKYIISSQCYNHLSTPYLLLGDVQEVIKILTGVEVPLEILTYKL